MISFVIVSYNGSQWIHRVLSTVFAECHGANVFFRIHIIDNGSDDETLRICRGNFPDVNIIEMEKNLGFGKANNIGIKEAMGEGANFVFLLNQDAWFKSGSLTELLEIARRNTEYGLLSPLHLNGDGTSLDGGFRSYIEERNCPGLYQDALLKNALKEVYPTKYVNAAAWLLSRETIETVGLFDPIFEHYGEDDNYLQRCLYHGIKIGIVPTAAIFHDREFRPRSKYFTDDYKNMNRKLKIKYADVNLKDAPERLNKRICELRKTIRKKIIRFRSIKAEKFELALLKQNKKSIVHSWLTNKQINGRVRRSSL